MIGYTAEDAKRIYSEAIAAWGVASQLLMAIEEMAELIQAICKDFRGKADYDNIAEETADVQIMLKQLQIIYDSGAAVQRFMDSKLARLEDRMKQSEQKKAAPAATGTAQEVNADR